MLLKRVKVQIDMKLSTILEHFTDSLFDPDHLGIYKRALSQHVEMYLKVGGAREVFCRCFITMSHLLIAAAQDELNRSCGQDLQNEFENARHAITSNIQALLPADMKADALAPQRAFDFNLSLNCEGLTENFRSSSRRVCLLTHDV